MYDFLVLDSTNPITVVMTGTSTRDWKAHCSKELSERARRLVGSSRKALREAIVFDSEITELPLKTYKEYMVALKNRLGWSKTKTSELVLRTYLDVVYGES